VNPFSVGSNDARSAAGMCAQCEVYVASARTARPIIPAAAMPSIQPVERTLRSLIHSIRATSGSP
jgi:hypothetical protein